MDLNIFYINIRSIRNKMQELETIAEMGDYHIIAVTETWLYSNEVDYFNISNYNAVHSCRDTRGGSVALYIKQGLQYESIRCLDPPEGCDIAGIRVKDNKLVTYVIYRSQICNVDSFLSYYDTLLGKNKAETIILGDINIDLLNSGVISGQYVDITLMNGYKIENIINAENVTRCGMGKQKDSIIDHVITNKKLICKIKTEVTCISDHNTLEIRVNKEVHRQDSKRIPVKYVDTDRWREILKSEMEENRIDKFEDLIEIIKGTKDKATNERLIKVRNNNYWVTVDFKKKVKERNKLYIKWKKTGSQLSELQFKRMKTKVNNLAKKLKKLWAEEELKKAGNDSRKSWRVLNGLINNTNIKKRESIDQIVDRDESIRDNKQMAEAFNSYFTNVGMLIGDRMPKAQTECDEENCQQIMRFVSVSSSEILKKLKSIKSNTCGYDCITKNDVLKIYDIIQEKLSQMINKILVNGHFPQELKTTYIIPVHKSGSKTERENYRPISITSVFSKIVEMLMKDQIVTYIKKNFGFDASQFGFQEGSSALGAATEVLEFAYGGLDKSNLVILVFIDLRKAFDTVDISILMRKMELMGFRGESFNLINSYLKGRYQYTVVNGVASERSSVKTGVPQGSVLGPLLYLLYVHSLKYLQLNAKYVTFADDTVLMFSGQNLEDLGKRVCEGLKIYAQWLLQNRLSINVDKTVYLLIKNKNKKINNNIKIQIDNTTIKQVKEYKYLGLTIDEKLNWSSHIMTVKNKLVPLIGALYRCSNILSTKTKKSVYHGLIESRLRYMIPCWGNGAATHIRPLEVVQNKAIKTIFGYNRLTSTEFIYKETGIMSISKIHHVEEAKLIHGIINEYFKTTQIVQYNRGTHEHGTRSQNLIRRPSKRTSKTQCSPVFVGSLKFNQLPEEIKYVIQKTKFTKLLMDYVNNM